MKKQICLLLFFMTLAIFPTVHVKSYDDMEKTYVVDNADLFTKEQELAYEEDIKRWKNIYGADVYVITLNSLGEKTSEEYVTEYYDTEQQGNDGVVFLVITKENNSLNIHTYGTFDDGTITQEEVEFMKEVLSPMIAEKNYDKAMELCEETLESSLYMSLSLVKFFKHLETPDTLYNIGFVSKIVANAILVIFPIGISFLIVLPFMKRAKKKLTSVEYKESAGNYIKPGSITVTRQDDILLYRKKHTYPRV